jgi:hypothetical protein
MSRKLVNLPGKCVVECVAHIDITLDYNGRKGDEPSRPDKPEP